MKHAFALAASLALLAACSGIPQSAPGDWGYQPGQRAPALISEVEAESLTEQVVSLKAQRATLANNLPRVSDPATRAQHMRSIDDLGAKLQMLEYRLRAAGRPVPR